MQKINLIKVSSVRQHSRCKKQVSRKQCEHHSLTYSASVHTRKKPQLPPRHLPHGLHYKPKLKIDSRLASKKKPQHSLGFFGLIGHRTTDHVTTPPPGARCVPSATPHCSRPLTAPRDTSPQAKTVASRQHTAKKHRPAQSRNRSSSPAPGKRAGFRLFSGSAAPSSFRLLTSHHSLPNQLFPFNRPRGISKAAN